MPSRTVVIGAAGFVGSAVAERLVQLGGEVLRIARRDIDLQSPAATEKLAQLLRPTDTCVFVAARAPCKTPQMLADNISMMAHFCTAYSTIRTDHVVYVSSDAVYADSDAPLTELSVKAPESLHGVMHLARERMLQDTVGEHALTILRPTLIYGLRDPHGGYGPNAFRQLAEQKKDITLFGEGEERRDHIYIDDVAEIVARVVQNRSIGTLNLVTGEVHSFREIAELVVELYGRASVIKSSPRKGPMPHRGFRPFDNAALRAAFPDLRLTLLRDGLRRVYAEWLEG
jgi:UDP-glucose 4-epimerase